jgi:hypothetical protein
VTLVANKVEYGESVSIGDNRFPVDQEGVRRECRDRCGGEWKPRSEIIIVTADEPDTGAVAPRQDTKSVMLDLVQPSGTGRRDLRWSGQTRERTHPGLGIIERNVGARLFSELFLLNPTCRCGPRL